MKGSVESWGPPVRETEANGITYMGWDFEYYRFKCKVHLVVQEGNRPTLRLPKGCK